MLAVHANRIDLHALKLAYSIQSTMHCLDAACVVSLPGNAARQLTRDLVAAMPKQGKFNNPQRPAANKLAVDPYLRVIGARDIIALGDCSMMAGNRLPATAQVGEETGRRGLW